MKNFKKIKTKNGFMERHGFEAIDLTKLAFKAIITTIFFILVIAIFIGIGPTIAMILYEVFNVDLLISIFVGTIPYLLFYLYDETRNLRNINKFPLSKEEIKMLDLKTVQDYSEYMKKCGNCHFFADEQIIKRIIISIYYNYGFDKEYKIYVREGPFGKYYLASFSKDLNIEEHEELKDANEIRFEDMFSSSVPLNSEEVNYIHNTIRLLDNFDVVFYDLALEMTYSCHYLHHCIERIIQNKDWRAFYELYKRI